jgi:hypothetical protein
MSTEHTHSGLVADLPPAWPGSEIELTAPVLVDDEVMRFGYDDLESTTWEQKLEGKIRAAALRRHR